MSNLNQYNLGQILPQITASPLVAQVYQDRSALAMTRPGRKFGNPDFLPDFTDGQVLTLDKGDEQRNALIAITYWNERLNCFDTLVITTTEEICAINHPYVTEYDNGGDERIRQACEANSFITGLGDMNEKLFFMTATTEEELLANLNAIIQYKQATDGQPQFFGKL